MDISDAGTHIRIKRLPNLYVLWFQAKHVRLAIWVWYVGNNFINHQKQRNPKVPICNSHWVLLHRFR